MIATVVAGLNDCYPGSRLFACLRHKKHDPFALFISEKQDHYYKPFHGSLDLE